jgi:hypothetical protein
MKIALPSNALELIAVCLHFLAQCCTQPGVQRVNSHKITHFYDVLTVAQYVAVVEDQAMLKPVYEWRIA